MSVCEVCSKKVADPFYSEEGDAFCGPCAMSNLAAQASAFRAVCEQIDAHYSASLDHQPAYVKAARRALEEW